jgi:hypothetical protein
MGSIGELVKWVSVPLLLDLTGYAALSGNFENYYTLHASLGIATNADTYVSILEATVCAFGIGLMMLGRNKSRDEENRSYAEELLG